MLLRVPRVVVLLLSLAVALSPAAALAHESRLVGGKYQLEVGFLDEPAVANQMNAISLTVATADGKPVDGVEATLKAEVIVGGNAKTMVLPLEANSGETGSYSANFIPTREGSYIFHFFGTIQGTPIDERFESGPGRFDDVQAAQSLQFPDKLPDPASAADVEAARQEASTARLFGIVGLVVGLLGLVVSATALASRRGSPGAPTRGVGPS